MGHEAPTAPPLECAVESVAGAEVVSCRGEVDIATAGRLRSALEEAASRSTAPVVADLREIRFMESSGLRVLLEAHSRLQQEGRVLSVACLPDGPLQRLFELTSTAEVLRVHATREDALADVAG